MLGETRDFLHRPRVSSVHPRVLLHTDRVLCLQRIPRLLLLKHTPSLVVVPFCISPHAHQCIEMFLSKWADFVLLSSVLLEESLSESMFDICITSCFLIPLVK